MPSRRRVSRPRVGLLGKFALASLLPAIVLGVVLSYVLRGEIRQRALLNARQSAALLEQSLVEPRLDARELRRGLTPLQVRRLDALLRPALAQNEIARIKVWNRAGRAVYATDHSLIGRRFTPSEELQRALGGRVASEISNLTAAENVADRRFGKLLEVYTPLRLGPSGGVVGAFEVYLPYMPIQGAIRHDTTRLSLILVGGLALLWLTLYRIVASASRRLRRQSAENEHLALHDPLTDLPNRRLFGDRAAQAILAARRDDGRVALLLLDVDRFKEVNDTLGHQNGDVLLREIGARLRGELRESDSVARLGGDEFGVLLPGLDVAAALAVAAKIRRSLQRPFVLGGVTLDLDASVGGVVYPVHGGDVETLLQRADVAMYLAKEDRSGCEVYDAGRDEYSPGRLALAGELRRGIERGELVLHYQPKADLASRRIRGVEALVRWQHPQRGLVGPDVFVPLAERTGLIRPLTHAVLANALRQAEAWQEQGVELSVAVNLSARDLLDVELPDVVRELLERHRVPAARLELEITESVILADPMRTRAVLSRLHAMGVVLAIDDFGTGYSSLRYLKRLPVAEIKIDRSFVMNMHQYENDAVIVRSTIELGRSLGLRVVAEGVESEAVWLELVRLGCDQAQGYYLSPPVPGDELAAWLRRVAADAAPLPAAAIG